MGIDLVGANAHITFRASRFQWRALCDVIGRAGLPVSPKWVTGDGDGLGTAMQCRALASVLETYLQDHLNDNFEVADCAFGIDAAGKLVPAGTPGSRPADYVHRDQVQAFADFLRTCGEGFDLY